MRHLATLFGILLLAPLAAAQIPTLPGTPATPVFGPPKTAVFAELNTRSLQPGQQAVLAVVIDIPKGYHAQSHTPSQGAFIKLVVTMTPPPAVQTFAPIYPPGKDEAYPGVGTLNVYDGRVIVYVPITVDAKASPGPLSITGKVRYQICDSAGTCFQPEEPAIAINTSIVPPGQPVDNNRPELFAGFDFARFRQLAVATAPAPEAAVDVDVFGFHLSVGQNSYVLWFALALLVGVVLNVMPCVLPIVPLKAMGFYESASHNRARSMMLGAVFSAGVVTVFAVLAIFVVALRVIDWGELFGKLWFAIPVSLLLLVVSLQMFGLFTVLLPSGVYNYVPSQQTASGNFAMGLFTAILSTPCTFGVFVVLLTWAVSRPAWLGVLLVMCVGVGMALPYFLLSAFPSAAKRIPRSGPWAETVKQLLGFLVLGSAIFFASPFIVPLIGDRVFWWILFAVIAAGGVFLVIRTLLSSSGARPVVIAVVLALAMIVPSLLFVRRLTRHLIDWQPFSEVALEQAIRDNKTVVVKFTAAWCSNCQAVEAKVFGDEDVARAVRDRGAVMLKADLTDTSAVGWTLLRKLVPVASIPLTAVYLPGQPQPLTLAGIYSTDDLLKAMAARDGQAKLPESAAAGGPK